MPRLVHTVLVAVSGVALTLAPGAAHAQQQQPQQQQRGFENLKVLPRDIPRDTLLQMMRGFTFALGVRCEYCHATSPNPTGGQPRLDAASDEKVAKEKARFMMRMTDSLNRVVLAALPDRRSPAIRVGCVTCHHGLAIPQTLASRLSAVIDSAGIDTAVARYATLHADMASGRFDFSEGSLNETARELAARGRTAEAIRILQISQKEYPNSAEIDVMLGDIHRQRNERDSAIARYRMALRKRPNDQRATQRLRELGAEVPAPARP